MPILVRPVREQLEHDRVIRLLQAKLKKKCEAEANPGDERNVQVKLQGVTLYPDLVLTSQQNGKKIQTFIEVETGESLNHMEAMAQWTHFSRAKAGFHLYVPAPNVDQAKRLMEQHAVTVTELWSYFPFGDEVRFIPVFRTKMPESIVKAEAPAVRAAKAARPAARAARPVAARPVPARPVAAKKVVRPARPARPAATASRARRVAKAAGATRKSPAVKANARATKKRRS